MNGTSARALLVRGVVQGVGFRPFVFRLARQLGVCGWARNEEHGVELHIEGPDDALDAFVRDLQSLAPAAAVLSSVDVRPAEVIGTPEFLILESRRDSRPTARISPDLATCDACLKELFDPLNERYAYPYINCTNCGPRYSIILGLPYDRPQTTMKEWTLCPLCRAEYLDPADRRFHAQPVACAHCGPHYDLRLDGSVADCRDSAIVETARLLADGRIVAVKGVGGYHLACDARQPSAVSALRHRKYRKDKPFALMVRDLETARGLVELSPAAEKLLTSIARPVVIAPARVELCEVSPDNGDLGLMLPYAPLHHLLFAYGAPDVLVLTSANRSSEPIAYQDQEALRQLDGIADAFLMGQRPIARRVDDSVVRAGVLGPVVLRRSRGYAPAAVVTLSVDRPILAVGADLKNAISLVVGGQVFVSQHIGDLDHYPALEAFEETIRDLLAMYDVRPEELLVAHDSHPQYASTRHALSLPAARWLPVQHHRAHIASVLAERHAWRTRVVAASFDGTGYGDDGGIWGGEIMVGSVAAGFERVGHLREAALPGGDAAARFPVQAAAGFLAQLDGLPDLSAAPFEFPARYGRSQQLVRAGTRTFSTTSMGRLFDCAAALMGFTRAITFEGQAAIWLEQLASPVLDVVPYPFPFADGELDFRPLLHAVVVDRMRGRSLQEISAAFHAGVANGLRDALVAVAEAHGLNTLVLSGGVFQNERLLAGIKALLDVTSCEVWSNHVVPPNDGGISLGQAAIAAWAGESVGRSEEIAGDRELAASLRATALA